MVRRGGVGTVCALVVALAIVGCAKPSADNRTQMALDSSPQGAHVTPVAPKARAVPDEAISNFDSLRNIAQTDIAALHQVENKGVVYVKPGTSVRPEEGGKGKQTGRK
jgi:hypothetical protein